MESPIGISWRVGLNTVPNVHTYSTSTPVSQLCQLAATAVPLDEYNQFNLQNINALTPSKWKIMRIYQKILKSSRVSCMHIFDGPMAHITNDKVKTNMFLIWAGPDAENIYENLHLFSLQQYNLDAVLETFERL